ncbi:MAG: hypothetical protein M3O71_10460 [Bacteroidota bacterium]|nr:hypothetical protein [Bacteroidota bacterium]
MPSQFESIEKELAITAKKARDLGYWFYNAFSKSWITPEEFEAQGRADLIVYGEKCRTVLTNYHMSDPKEGIRLRIAVAKRATIDLQDFAEKVFAYFNQVPKDKK